MAKAYGRKTKKKVGEILHIAHQDAAMEMLAQIPDKQLIGHLFSYFYNRDELIKFRSITAMGALGARMGQEKMEPARNLLRRIMWNLNDESGGIGWGSPEAMGEILCQSPGLAREFKSILFSYLRPGGNFVEHEMLQRGVLWGVGTYLKSNPKDLEQETKELLSQHLQSLDSVKSVYALRALLNTNYFQDNPIPDSTVLDRKEIDIFKNWHFIRTSAFDMVQQAVTKY
ncbi:MAG: hypothetical protein GY857_07630 [Desulfobacula sp.]|nr:hypothetical protein [Desulfobacula sp.]